MKQRELFEKLISEKVVLVPYEATISIQLDSMVGDVPVYKFVVQYFKNDEEGLVTETLKTYDELIELIEREVAFRKCSECGELITEGFIANQELGEDYCCVPCMIKAMDRKYGKGNWRFKLAKSIIDEADETIVTSEYQYEIMTDQVRLEVFKHMVEEQDKEFIFLEKEEDSLEEVEQDDTFEDTMIHLLEATWVPYHMYYCPPIFDEKNSGNYY